MTKKQKIILWSSVAGVIVIIGAFSVRPIQRVFIRRRLNEAYKNPNSVEAAGGLNKLLVTEAFDMNAYDDQNNHSTISLVEAREKAKIIYDNYSSWLSSNQTAIVNAFSGLGHVDDVSKIAKQFYLTYDEDLLQVLQTALTDKAKYNLLIGKINSLPKN